MKPEQITALAREYAEECVDPQGFSKSTYEELVEEKAENVDYVLSWLSTRFCLVEKEAVRTAYQQAMEQGKHAHLKCQVESRAKLRLLESLFPDIAKDVEDGMV